MATVLNSVAAVTLCWILLQISDGGNSESGSEDTRGETPPFSVAATAAPCLCTAQRERERERERERAGGACIAPQKAMHRSGPYLSRSTISQHKEVTSNHTRNWCHNSTTIGALSEARDAILAQILELDSDEDSDSETSN